MYLNEIKKICDKQHKPQCEVITNRQEDISMATITLDFNMPEVNYRLLQKQLLNLAEEHNCCLQKTYWKSKLDDTCLDLFEPKIIDPYLWIIDFCGNESSILKFCCQLKSVLCFSKI